MTSVAEIDAHVPAAVRLAETLAAVDGDALPAAIVVKAKLALIDYLACAFESRGRAWCRQAVELAARSPAAAGASSIVGVTDSVALDGAVLANAVLGHGLVRDDMHLGSISHLGVAVMPVALGLAELEQVDGRRLLAAITAGYEAGGRIGRAILDARVARIHRPTGITGPFAAAATAARLLRLDVPATASGLSLAANTTGGFNEWAASGGDEMFFHAGLAARNGLTAARLAHLGARASADAIDGPAGLLAAFGKRGATGFETAAGFELEHVFFKQVPACNYAQSPAQAARALAARHAPAVDDIERVTVRVSRAAADYPGCDARGPFTRELQAKMSIQYNVAAVLATGAFDAASYEPERNPAIGALARRVGLVVDAALTRAYPARQAAEVAVRLRDGRELGERVGDVEPADAALVQRRFTQAAEAVIGAAGTERLLDFVDRLESSANAGELLRLTRPGEPL